MTGVYSIIGGGAIAGTLASRYMLRTSWKMAVLVGASAAAVATIYFVQQYKGRE
jgi:hypothetical protein